MGRIGSRLKRKVKQRAKRSINNQKNNPRKAEILRKLIIKYKK